MTNQLPNNADKQEASVDREQLSGHDLLFSDAQVSGHDFSRAVTTLLRSGFSRCGLLFTQEGRALLMKNVRRFCELPRDQNFAQAWPWQGLKPGHVMAINGTTKVVP